MSRTVPLCLGLTVYNGERYVAEAIKCALAQSFGDFELVISDNASTDATEDICRHYARQDRRIRYLRNDVNIGAGPNFNRAFAACQSPFYKWVAHDDLMAPSFLEQCMAVLRADAGVVLAHSELSLIDDDGQPLIEKPNGKVVDRHGNRHHNREPRHLGEGVDTPQRFAEVLRRMNWCTALFGVVRSDALRRTHLLGGYYEADRVLLAELALLGRFRQVSQPLFLKRCHAGVSVLKGFRARARMMDPSIAPLLPGMRLRAGYLGCLTVGDLPLRERLACAATIARLCCRSSLLYQMRSRLGGYRQALPVEA